MVWTKRWEYKLQTMTCIYSRKVKSQFSNLLLCVTAVHFLFVNGLFDTCIIFSFGFRILFLRNETHKGSSPWSEIFVPFVKDGKLYLLELRCWLVWCGEVDPVSTQFDVCMKQSRMTFGCVLTGTRRQCQTAVARLICFVYYAHNITR
jgi:hypothetical protein